MSLLDIPRDELAALLAEADDEEAETLLAGLRAERADHPALSARERARRIAVLLGQEPEPEDETAGDVEQPVRLTPVEHRARVLDALTDAKIIDPPPESWLELLEAGGPVAAGLWVLSAPARTACDGPYLDGSWAPHSPWPKQDAFLTLEDREGGYGGAAGGGKSDGLLMGALQYVCVPDYHALLLRETSPQLHQEDGLIPRAEDWLASTAAVWKASDQVWTFPSGATITLGYIDRPAVRYKFAGGAWQFIGWDELTNWPTDVSYRFLFSRLRRKREDEDLELRACPDCGLTVADVPLRVRFGTNPGSLGEEWVNARVVEPWKEQRRPARPFMPALLRDNPALDWPSYIAALGELDPTTRAQLLEGIWGMRPQGSILKRQWFRIEPDWPRDAELVRRWDLAATEVEPGNDPDFTVGALVALKDGRWWLVDIVRDRLSPAGVETLVASTAQADRDRYGHVPQRMEQEPGASGKSTIAHFQLRILVGFDFKGVPATGSKAERARVLAAAAEPGNFTLVRAGWNEAWLDEAASFTGGDRGHDDQVDATSSGMHDLSSPRASIIV